MENKLFSWAELLASAGIYWIHNPPGVSNLWNMPKLDQLKCDFSSLSLAVAFLLPFSSLSSLFHSLFIVYNSIFDANVFIKWQSSGFNYYNLRGSIKTHKKERGERAGERGSERERERKRVRKGEVSNWAALLKWPQVPSSSNTNNKPRRAGGMGQVAGQQQHAAEARTGAD